jgi:hypothetical protein
MRLTKQKFGGMSYLFSLILFGSAFGVAFRFSVAYTVNWLLNINVPSFQGSNDKILDPRLLSKSRQPARDVC